MDAKSGERIEVENPANGEVFATLGVSTKEEVLYALETSEKAQQQWKALPAITRGRYLMAIVDKLQEERNHFAKLLVKEQGKTLAEAYGEVDDTMRYPSVTRLKQPEDWKAAFSRLIYQTNTWPFIKFPMGLP